MFYISIFSIYKVRVRDYISCLYRVLEMFGLLLPSLTSKVRINVIMKMRQSTLAVAHLL